MGTTRGLRRAGTAGSAGWPSLNPRMTHESRLERKLEQNKRCRPCRPAGGLPVVLLLVFLAVACGKSNDEVATFKVEPLQFTRRVTAEGTLKAVKATPVTAPHDAPQALKVSWIADDGALLKKDEVIVRFDATDFENMLLRGNEDRTTASNKLNKAGAEAGATRTNLKRDAKQAQAELDAAKRFTFDDAEVFSRYARIEAEVDQGLAGHKKTHAEEVLVVRDSLARVERDLLSIEDRKAGMKITQAEQGLRALQVVAPHDGILVLSRNWRGDMPRIGDMMWRGQPIGEIPELATDEGRGVRAGSRCGRSCRRTEGDASAGVAARHGAHGEDQIGRQDGPSADPAAAGAVLRRDRRDRQPAGRNS